MTVPTKPDNDNGQIPCFRAIKAIQRGACPEPSRPARLLLCGLLGQADDEWTDDSGDWFPERYDELAQRAFLEKSRMYTAREELKAKGYIDFKESGNRHKPMAQEMLEQRGRFLGKTAGELIEDTLRQSMALGGYWR